MKISGLKKKYQTSRSVKTVSLDVLEIDGPAGDVAATLKSLMT
jgi:hypothetical protein